MKVETIACGWITSIDVYPWSGSTTSMNEYVKITAADMRANPELCWQMWVKAFRSLPAGYYTIVLPSTVPKPYVQDILVGKRGGVSVRPYDGKTMNTTQQRPCLRIEVEGTFERVEGYPSGGHYGDTPERFA
jgi:hypothetical protein